MQQKKILIIEDDKDISDILEIIFTDQGYEVILSETGEDLEDLELILPNLILLDLRLNKSAQDGVAICILLKSQPTTKSLPIILLSAEQNLHNISKNCGANGYITKPFDIDTLCKKVEELIN